MKPAPSPTSLPPMRGDAAPAANAADAAPPVASPCVDVCRMDTRTGWCEGCLRTLDEIAAWSSLPEPVKREVCAELPARRVARDRGRPR